jgi:hypothetical protein
MQKHILAGSFLLFLMACSDTNQQQKLPQQYFDLKGYMQQEAARLNQTKPLVFKTVSVNDSTESRKVRIADWNKELANFSDADINKSAWQGMFKVERNKQQEVYSSNDDKVLVKKLEISRKNNKITSIKVLLNTSNYLYHSTDTLAYYPDSLYEIRKTQQIRFLSVKRYLVKGTF